MSTQRLRRFEEHSPWGKPIVLPPDHPAALGKRTIFPNRVGTKPMAWKGGPDLPLKSGFHSRKIGKAVTKGEWAGMPVFTLTLEERATCPTTCRNWFTCYGNRMDKAPRQIHGEALQARIVEQLEDLSRQYKRGFVLRLHVLGDFYAPGYVKFWAEQMFRFKALRVFGYTAWPPHTEIGGMIQRLNNYFSARWFVRFSDGPLGVPNTETIRHPSAKSPTSIICPAQHHPKANAISCSSCALCWSTDRTIAFLEH